MQAFPKEIDKATMKVRHIGVENELEAVGLTDAVQRELSRRGLLQSVGYDGGGREFRTVPISVRSLKQVRGFKYVSEYYEELKKQTSVIESGGTHIHISILDTDNPNLEANVTAMGIAFFKQLQKISGRETHWAPQLPHRTLSEVKAYVDSYRIPSSRAYQRKGGILGPTRHQTFEFRGPMGSNDSQEILAWVELLDNLVKACNRDSIEGTPFSKLLEGERISSYVTSLSGWRNLTNQDLSMQFVGSRLQ